MTLFGRLSGLATLLLCLPASLDGERPPVGALALLDGRPLWTAEFQAYVGREHRFETRATKLLQLMIQQSVILVEAERQSLSVNDDELSHRLQALDRETSRQSDGTRNLQAVLDDQGITSDEFLPSLKISLLAEKLVRREFEIPDGQAVPYEKTQLWIEERLDRAVIQTTGLPPEILVQVDGQPIGEIEFGRRYLLDQKAYRSKWLEEFIDSEVIHEAGRRQGVEIGPAELDAGIRRRERKLLDDPRYSGATLEELLQKTGRSLAWLRSSAEFRTQVLLEQMVRERYPGGRLEGYYQDHRAEFDRLHGPSVRLRAILLKAGHEGALSRGFVPRLYEDAEAELTALRERIVAGQASLVDLAARRSEHPSSRSGGDLGFVSAAHPQLGQLARAGLEAQDLNQPLGPLRAAEGVYLFEVLERREKPGYDEIRDQVLDHAAHAMFEQWKGAMRIVRRDPLVDR